MSDTFREFHFDRANCLAETAVFQAVIAQCLKTPGLDAEMIARVALEVEQMVEDDADEEARFNGEQCERFHDMQRFLTATPAHTLVGLRAKAIIVRRYHGPGALRPAGDEDDAVAWSLAGDLLGLPSPVYGESAQ